MRYARIPVTRTFYLKARGEWQYAGELLRQFATYHRKIYFGCNPAPTDVYIRAASAVHGGGSPDMGKKAILADYDLTEHMRIAKKLAGIIK